MIGKLLGRLAYRGWRDGWRADRRGAKGRDERRWRRDYADEADHPPIEDETTPADWITDGHH